MSLRIATLPVTAHGTQGAGTEQRPRILHQPNANPDAEQKSSGLLGKLGASSEQKSPYTRPHGNAKPQEPGFHRTWSLNSTKPAVQHPHPKPWTMSTCPGKRESPEGCNLYHRVWLQDTSINRTRWNRDRKHSFYAKQDKELLSKLPPDEQHSRHNGASPRFWTHLIDGGEKAGGQSKKLDYQHRGPNSNACHFYKGRFSSVKHLQKIWRRPADEKRSYLCMDRRPEFDSRVHDDIIKVTQEKAKWELQSSYDTLRPANTLSCPQLGADFVTN